MGVVNVTPDSFSDGGVNFDRDRAVEYGLKLLQDGADIVDVGGESTRPGAKVVSATDAGDSVSEKEELERVIPVISAVKQKNPKAIVSLSDVVTVVKRELRERSDAAVIAGMKRERLVIDPGFGFGKNREENYPLLRRLEEFHQLRFPLLVGVSRKSFIGRALARNGTDLAVTDRLFGTLAAETVAILKGAHIIRTHDVRACADAVRIADLAAS